MPTGTNPLQQLLELATLFSFHSQKTRRAPLIIDSPYGGDTITAEKQLLIDSFTKEALLDNFINDMLMPAHAMGATVMSAKIARISADLDRPFDSILVDHLQKIMPDGAFEKTGDLYTDNGLGFYWFKSLILGNGSLYDPFRHPNYHDLSKMHQQLIEPYMIGLLNEVGRNQTEFGVSYHISIQPFSDDEAKLFGCSEDNIPHFVICDGNGKTSDALFLIKASDSLTSRGYTVAINDVFPQGELIKATGHPDKSAHSLQIKIRQSLYRNPETLERLPHARKVSIHLREFLGEMIDFTRSKSLHIEPTASVYRTDFRQGREPGPDGQKTAPVFSVTPGTKPPPPPKPWRS